MKRATRKTTRPQPARRRPRSRASAAAKCAPAPPPCAPLPHAPAMASVLRRWATCWRPRPRVKTAEWAEQHLRLSAEVGSSPGRFQLERMPYLRYVLDAFDDPQVERITLQWATRLGKTLALQIMLGSVAVNRPAPCLLATPDKDSSRKLRDKFRLLCEASPALREVSPSERRWNDRQINFRALRCYLGYAGSSQSLSGESCQYVFKTELDRWPDQAEQGSSSSKADQRVKDWFRSKIVEESTPTDETSAICGSYAQSNRSVWAVPCPHCGHYQELRFFAHREGPYAGHGCIDGLRHEDGSWRAPDEVLRTAYYTCERGCKIENRHRRAMIARGVGCPEGCQVGPDGQLTGQPKQSRRHVGLRLSSIYADPLGFGQVAAEYLRVRDDPTELQVYWNDWLGLRYTRTRKAPKWQQLGRRLEAPHRRGTVPAGAIFLTAFIDTQDEALYWSVRAWGERATSWLVDAGKINKVVDGQGQPIPGSDLDAMLPTIFDRDWPLVQPNAVGQSRLKVFRAGQDQQGHRTWEVFNWHKAHSAQLGQRLILTAGDARLPKGMLYEARETKKNSRTGREYPGGMRYTALDVDAFKDDLSNRFTAPLDQPGAWFLFADPLNEVQDYLRQLCNEGRREKRNKAGRQVVGWEVIDHRLGNHYWDCEVGNRAIAEIAVDGNWTDLAARAVQPRPAAHVAPPELTAPDGRAFLISERTR